MMSNFIGRDIEREKICSILNSENKVNPKLISIGGPGGVGKSTLLEEIMNSDEWNKQGNLIVRIDNNQIKSLEGLILEDLIRSAKIELGGGYGYFKETEKALKLINEIDIEFEKRLRKELQKDKKISNEAIENIVNIAMAFGQGITPLNKKLGKVMNFEKLNSLNIDKDIKSILIKINTEMSGGVLSNIAIDIAGNRNLKEKLRQNRNNGLADSLNSDFHTILFGAKDLKHKLKPTQKKSKQFNKLIIIIEDYENKQNILDEFLIGNLNQRFRAANFDTTIIIVGRDIITNISSDWSHKWKKNIALECDLDKFSEDEAREFLNGMDITDDKTIEYLFEITEGYPYLLELEVENLKSKKGSSHTNKMFYDRTTKWMNETQRSWFESICYLNKVNEDTILRAMPDEDNRLVYSWFENEPSIRDTSAEYYCVRPFIRKKIQSYLEAKSPSLHTTRLSQIGNIE